MTLRQMREAAGLSQEAVASIAGVTQSAISQIEIGCTLNPGMKLVQGLARAFKCSTTRIMDALAETLASTASAAQP